MVPNEWVGHTRKQVRHELLRRYTQLQRELAAADPASSAYQSTIHAFREMGYLLIRSGFEDDLDRLLRIRVLDGGRAERSPRSERSIPEGLHMIERRGAV